MHEASFRSPCLQRDRERLTPYLPHALNQLNSPQLLHLKLIVLG